VGATDNNIYLFARDGDALRPTATLQRHRAPITALAFSPDGASLASADAAKEALVWSRSAREVIKSKMVFHSARVQCLAWSPDSTRIGESSLPLSRTLPARSPPRARRPYSLHCAGSTRMLSVSSPSIMAVTSRPRGSSSSVVGGGVGTVGWLYARISVHACVLGSRRAHGTGTAGAGCWEGTRRSSRLAERTLAG